jgi:predicted ribosome quality control (RQC) complex YloA/Tae2 family protein
MSAQEIASVVAEAALLLVDGIVVRVREPMPHHLALEIRKGGRNHELVLGVAAGLSRIHLAHDLPPTPPGPCPLTLRARKRMRPGRVTSLCQVGGDRVVRLSVSQHQQETGPWQTTLVAELFGRGRLFLLDGDDVVLAVSGPGGPRGLSVGQPYEAPSAGPNGVPEAATGVDSSMLERRYQGWMAGQGEDSAQRQAETRHRREVKRLQRRIAALEKDLMGLADWQSAQRRGELLAGHRHLLKRGMASVTVNDWFDPACPELLICLDKALTPEENVERQFKRAAKGKKGIPKLTLRIAEDRAALAALEATGPKVEEAVPATSPSGKKGERWRWFETVSGWRVYVGRSAADNDRITFKLANGNDFWFHARETPGSHVLLKGSGEPPQKAIHDAARLAAHFSKLKQAGGGEVMYSQRKYLRRPKGGRPGQVLVTQEKVIAVDLASVDMAELLATRKIND